MTDTQLHGLRMAHNEAQTARRALEKEQKEIGGLIEFAMSGADVGELQRLNRRKRQLPEELQTASAVEHAAYRAYVRGEEENEDRLRREAKAKYDAALAQLNKRREEWASEQAGLVAAVDRAQLSINAHQRELETWSTRFSVADRRYREAVAEQEAA